LTVTSGIAITTISLQANLMSWASRMAQVLPRKFDDIICLLQTNE
jgi:hypothetical protein